MRGGESAAPMSIGSRIEGVPWKSIGVDRTSPRGRRAAAGRGTLPSRRAGSDGLHRGCNPDLAWVEKPR
jgi:hypothetical protein